MTIDHLPLGAAARVRSVGGEESLRRHLLDLGFVPGSVLKLVKRAPMGDPVEVRIHGYSLTLRLGEVRGIEVEEIPAESSGESSEDFSYNLSLHEHNAHPGYGEEGKYHSHEGENPLPKGSRMTFAVVGQPNCGKTALFNCLTGSNEHVGNFPGVTVERKDGLLKDHPDVTVIDLPGTYSMNPYSSREFITRRFLLDEKPSAIINVVDAGNIERNLYLTVQLMELGVPMVLALNMMDELRANGGGVRLNEMERMLGMPVVPVSAARGEGIAELVEHTLHTAKYREAPARHDFCDPEDGGGAVHRCLHSIMHLVEDHAGRADMPLRFAASRLVDGDTEVMDRLQLSGNEKEMLEHIVLQMEEERGLDRHSSMADMRYSFVGKLCTRTVRRPRESREQLRSRRMDRVLTGRWTAIPSFIVIMALIFWLTFDVIGAGLQRALAAGIGAAAESLGRAFEQWNVSAPVRSLVLDGVFGGVGAVVSFVPVILVLFLFLSILEDSGYMARIAFVSDKLLRRLGLSGRSIVPMLIGFGCTVPGVMAARTLPSSLDRRRTILMLPFMSCSAKIAVYGFLAESFFPGKAGIVMISLYLLGIFVGVVYAVVTKLLHRSRVAAPFVMELPVYRLPMPRNVGHLLWDKTKDFIRTAFTVIFIASLVVWVLQSFSWKLEFVSGEGSMLSSIAGWIAPVMRPLGLGDWRIVTALISGFLAKESIVATLQVLGATSVFTVSTAVPMLVFSLLYTPCVASIAAIRRELGRWMAAGVVVFQTLLAWVCAWVAYMIVLL